MPEQRFFIGPPQSGLQNDLKSWLIPDDAYWRLNNAYVWRGSLRKRFGSSLLVTGQQTSSRLRVQVGTLNTPSSPVPGGSGELGQMFSVGEVVMYVHQATGNLYVANGTAATATFTTATGVFSITGVEDVNGNPLVGTTPIFWYPSLPVMGLITFDTDNISDEFPIAFDTQYAYKRENAGWKRLDQGVATWTGNNSQFFWGTNYRAFTADENILFVTNFVNADGIRYYNDVAINGGAIVAETWTKAAFKYSPNATDDDIITARIIVYFKDRLVLLNTVEEVSSSNKSFPNRCRFSQNGSPFSTEAWYQAPFAYGKGGFIDAPTTEAIVTAQFLKDRLIVFFERSTYELVYTGNRIQPFVWQKINTELGAESTFSQVPFDNVVLGVGNVGIHACDGASVQRIDEKIPQEVFRVRNITAGLERVAGIRDYRVEMVYFTFPSASHDQTFPNRVLVYNYQTGTWAFNDDTITAFGYWQRENNEESPTWATLDIQWQVYDLPWWSGNPQPKERFVLAGNQQGWTFYLDANISRNSQSLQITDFNDTNNRMTIYNHNLTGTDNTGDDFIYVEGMEGITSLNDQVFQIDRVDDNTITILNRTPGTGTYTGGGTVSLVSRIQAYTKDFNFFNKEGKNVAINRVECYVDTTANGEIKVDPVASNSGVLLSESADGSALNPVLGTSILETKRDSLLPFPNKKRAWRSVFINSEGESVSLWFYLDDTQMLTPSISREDFQLNAMIVYATPTADR